MNNKKILKWINLILIISTLFFLIFPLQSVQAQSKTAADYLKDGIDLLNAKKYQDAIIAFEKTIQIDPQNIEAHYQMGNCYYDQKNSTEALKEYDICLGLNPKLESALKGKMLVFLYLANKPDEALKYANLRLQINPNSSDAYFSKGISLYYLENFEESIIAFDNSVKINPDNWDAAYSKAYALIRLAKYDEAINICDEIIQKNANIVQAYSNKGYALFNLGRNKEAIEAYNESIELSPGNDNGYFRKAEALSRLGEYKEAIVAFKKAEELDSESIAPVYIARIYYKQGNFKDAINTCQKMNEHFPDYIPAYLEKIRALLKTKGFDGADQACDLIIKNKTSTVNYLRYAYAYKGIAFKEQGFAPEATEFFTKALSLESNTNEEKYNKACILSLMSKKAESVSLLKEIINSDIAYKYRAIDDADFDNLVHYLPYRKLVGMNLFDIKSFLNYALDNIFWCLGILICLFTLLLFRLCKMSKKRTQPFDEKTNLGN